MKNITEIRTNKIVVMKENIGFSTTFVPVFNTLYKRY